MFKIRIIVNVVNDRIVFIIVYVFNVWVIDILKNFLINQKSELFMCDSIIEFVFVVSINSSGFMFGIVVVIGVIIFVVVVIVIVVELIVVWINFVIINVSMMGERCVFWVNFVIVLFILFVVKIFLMNFFFLSVWKV